MALQNRIDKLAPRERRLLMALAGTLGALVFLGGPIGILSVLSRKQGENQELRNLLQTIQESTSEISERKAKQDALLARYAKPAPQLAGFIDEAAKANGISAAESQDRPDVPHGKRYVERIAVVKMHKVGMLALAKTLERIEQSGHPVAISRLNVKPRSGEPDSYEVELGVSAFERKGEAASTAAGAGSAAAGSTGRSQ